MSFQIETGRLIMRDVREDDIPILVKQFAEPEARENILSFQADESYNRNELEKAMAWAQESHRPFYTLAVELKSDGTVIGDCSLFNAVREASEANIGWHYGHRFRGNGYATEAARALLDFGFEFVGVNEIYADCFDENGASRRILEKIGMRASLDFSLFNMFRGWGYGENKLTARYIISNSQWLAQTKRLKELS